MEFLLLGVAPAIAAEGHETDGAGAVQEGEGADEYALHVDQIVYGVINLSIFLVLLYLLARKPVAAWVANRAASIRSGLDEAARVQAEARSRFDAVERRLESLDGDLETLRADARSDADREGRLLEARAESEANRVRESAERAIREESARARAEIREEAVALAMQLARETLSRSISQDDQERLAREFLAAVDADKTARSAGATK